MLMAIARWASVMPASKSHVLRAIALLVVGAVASGCSSSSGGAAAAAGDASTMIGDTDAATTANVDAGDAASAGDGSSPGDAGDSGAVSGPHSFAAATPFSVGTLAPGRLVDPETPNYYMVTATADQQVVITVTTAEPEAGGDPSVIDSVVTVFDSTHAQIAQNNDIWPGQTTDSRVFFDAPADGVFYFTVGDCNSLGASAKCNDPQGISNFVYQVDVALVASGVAPAYAGTAQDGTPAHAVTVPYEQDPTAATGNYSQAWISGDFAAAGASQVFSFTPPAGAATVAGQRLYAQFFLQSNGTDDGDGSTADVTLSVTDAVGTVLSEADGKYYSDGLLTNAPLRLVVPVTPGQPYYLYVKSDQTTLGAKDYYYIVHELGPSGYPLEGEGATSTGANDTMATAEFLESSAVDGNLPAGDVDWFNVAIPARVSNISFQCSVARNGSGLRGFTMSGVFSSSVVEIVNQPPVTVTEPVSIFGPEATNPTTDLVAGGEIPVTDDGNTFTNLYLKVTATSQDATDTGTFYECSVSFP